MPYEDIKRIVEFFSKERGVDPELVLGKSEKRAVCTTRAMVYKYLHVELELSSYAISRYFEKTRRGVMGSIHNLNGWMQYHSPIRDEYELIVDKLRQHS